MEESLATAAVTILLGIFLWAAPERSARLWGRQDLARLPAPRRNWYLRGFRALGALLLLAGVLVTAQALWFRG